VALLSSLSKPSAYRLSAVPLDQTRRHKLSYSSDEAIPSKVALKAGYNER
jgi:hypothetical protein